MTWYNIDTNVEKEEKNPSLKNIIIGIVIIAIIGLTLFYFGFFNLPEPCDDCDINDEYDLLWEGEITDKKIEMEIDHEVYYLRINGTIWESVNQIHYYKYEINDYVYYYDIGDVNSLVDEEL